MIKNTAKIELILTLDDVWHWKNKNDELSSSSLHVEHSNFAANASINSSGAHPPPGNRGAFAHLVSPWGGVLANFIAARGLGVSIPRGNPWAFDTRIFERWMSLSGRTRPLSKTGLSVRD